MYLRRWLNDFGHQTQTAPVRETLCVTFQNHLGQLKYPKGNSIAEVGVGYIGSIVNHHNCIIRENDTNSNLGILQLLKS